MGRQRNFKTGDVYLQITVTANARKEAAPEGGAEVWVVDENSFCEKEGDIDVDAVRANPEAYLHYVPSNIRQSAREKAQLMLDKLRNGCPIVPVPSYRGGAAVCNRAADQVKLVAGLAMGGLPYYELASGEIVTLSTGDIQSIAVDVAAAETAWQQAKQACWAAIDAAQGEEEVAAALAEFATVLSAYAGEQLTQAMNMNTDNKTSWLAGLLSGWGIKESWAKIIAGSIAGALAATGFLTSCTEGYSPVAEAIILSIAAAEDDAR